MTIRIRKEEIKGILCDQKGSHATDDNAKAGEEETGGFIHCDGNECHLEWTDE